VHLGGLVHEDELEPGGSEVTRLVLEVVGALEQLLKALLAAFYLEQEVHHQLPPSERVRFNLAEVATALFLFLGLQMPQT
jgi:hypothetical protein